MSMSIWRSVAHMQRKLGGDPSGPKMPLQSAEHQQEASLSSESSDGFGAQDPVKSPATPR